MKLLENDRKTDYVKLFNLDSETELGNKVC